MSDVLAIRRYPVKSMGGEPLASVVLDERGLAGDRWWAVTDDEGRLASGKNSRRFRRRDGVFDYLAATGPDGVRITGPGGTWAAGDPALDEELVRVLGDGCRVAEESGTPHQDAGAVSLVGTASLAWCAEHWGLDADPRRLRANLVVETTEPFVEETWVGHEIEVGSARLRVVERVERCRMIDLAQDGVATTARWLKPLAAERALSIAVYADVSRPGTISVGDAIVVC
ncbi:MAG: MOSC domain-containing protein [Nocardioides sp.]